MRLQEALQQVPDAGSTESNVLVQMEKAQIFRRQCLETTGKPSRNRAVVAACAECSSSLLYCQACVDQAFSSIAAGSATAFTDIGTLDIKRELSPYAPIYNSRTDHPVQRYLTPGALYDPPLISGKALEDLNITHSNRESVCKRLLIAEANYNDTHLGYARFAVTKRQERA
ncbi:hypothetical protein FQN49_001355 [Arthroderma sp. PD_2]|nr:hypothetical protein FQN49_001355 [Arthroderma sp. PD_2]